MLPTLVFRTLRNADFRCIRKFAWNFGVKGLLSVERFKRRIKRGEFFPPFLYVSILNSCNLRCQGCWVDVEEKDAIDLETLNRTITEAKQHGNAFFGILGGEPFMHLGLLDLLAAHPDCYFQVFSREGVAVPMGELELVTEGWSFIPVEMARAHATALEIACDGSRELASIELRATCSEGVIGLMGVTAIGV